VYPWFPAIPVFFTGAFLFVTARARWEPLWDSDKMQEMFYSFGEDNVRAMHMVMGAALAVTAVLFGLRVFG
jgi:hypothetical protein